MHGLTQTPSQSKKGKKPKRSINREISETFLSRPRPYITVGRKITHSMLLLSAQRCKSSSAPANFSKFSLRNIWRNQLLESTSRRNYNNTANTMTQAAKDLAKPNRRANPITNRVCKTEIYGIRQGQLFLSTMLLNRRSFATKSDRAIQPPIGPAEICQPDYLPQGHQSYLQHALLLSQPLIKTIWPVQRSMCILSKSATKHPTQPTTRANKDIVSVELFIKTQHAVVLMPLYEKRSIS